MGLTNDERGWVMTLMSGLACMVGASIICIDIIIQQFPGKKDFRIQDSDTFLSASLSLSFGVMLFSALYSMLPSAKKSLTEGGFTPKQAAWILIACFLGGAIGIQFLSRIMHHFIPSHIVDCEHSHEDAGAKEDGDAHTHEAQPTTRPPQMRSKSSLPGRMRASQPPGSRQTSYFGERADGLYASNLEPEVGESLHPTMSAPSRPSRRPSLQQRLTRGLSQLASNKKSHCDRDGPCYGFSDVCGQECFKIVNARGGSKAPIGTPIGGSRPQITKSSTMQSYLPASEATPLLPHIDEERVPHLLTNNHQKHDQAADGDQDSSNNDLHASSSATLADEDHDLHKTVSHESGEEDPHGDHHHHHVPTNAFLSIGLQTSIAIALHKLPEGFITYATNHANPKLGVAVFLALFIHNITEGFAMALPLYLAINSRIKAMSWSFVLGGLSQPLGAGVAALWFKLAGKGDWAPSEGVYGGMFAVTAGIMASVALQLFSEALDLTHSRTLCMIAAFTGMGILGISSALTA